MITAACVSRKYLVPEISEAVYDFIGCPADNKNWIAMEAGRDFYENHDGWECKWPLKIRLLDADNKPLGDFMVDVELEPNFISKKIE